MTRIWIGTAAVAVFVSTTSQFAYSQDKLADRDKINSERLTQLEKLGKASSSRYGSVSSVHRGSFEFNLATAQWYAHQVTEKPVLLQPGPFGRYSGRIVGGTPAGDGEFPWQVALLQSQTGNLFCSGTYLGGGWIVTAAHCINDGTGPAITKDDVIVLFGTNSLTTGGTRVPLVQDPVVHEDWDPSTGKNDIALVKIDEPSNLSAARIPLDVVEPPMVSPGAVLTVSGWGTTTEGGTISVDLLKVDVPVVALDVCQTNYPNVTDSQICAGVDGRDSCQGDSGGPMTGIDDNGRVLVGIVSNGIGCARPGIPGVYTRVIKYKDWIHGKTG